MRRSPNVSMCPQHVKSISVPKLHYRSEKGGDAGFGGGMYFLLFELRIRRTLLFGGVIHIDFLLDWNDLVQ